MRILMFSNTFPPGYTGGAEVSNFHTLRGLVARGHDVSICVARNREAEKSNEWYSLDDIPVHRIHFKSFLGRRDPLSDIFDWRVYKIACKEISSLKPDIVHITNVSGSSLAPFAAARHAHIPAVSMLHDLWMLCPNNMRYQLDGEFCDPKSFKSGCRKCFRRYDYWGAIPKRQKVIQNLTSRVKVFVSPSQALIERHVEAGYPRERFRKVPYGFACEAPPPVKTPAVEELLKDRHTKRTIIFVGGGVEIKGAKVVAKAIPLIEQGIKNVRFIIAGGGDLMHLFNGLASDLRVLDRIPFSDAKRLFSISDLALLPSVWHENLPVVMFEAFQRGVPVVGSDFGGIPEMVNPYRTGYLFPVGSAVDLANKVCLHFKRSGRDIRQMRRECVRLVTEEFSLASHLDKLEEVYQMALSKN